MKPSANFKIGSAFGIDIQLHWSFFLLPLVVACISVFQGDSIYQMALWIVFLVIILASVLIHEMGHALAAKRTGIPIVDIMLTPICGLARLERAPDTPRDEVIVALAGPLTNFCLAAVMGMLIMASGADFSVNPNEIRGSLLLTVFCVNASLFLLNLLPIFPMDGGRVMRAVMAMFLDGRKATLVAARLGQFFSVLAVLAGIYWNVLPLVIIGFFLFFTAEQEIRMQRFYPDESTSQ